MACIVATCHLFFDNLATPPPQSLTSTIVARGDYLHNK